MSKFTLTLAILAAGLLGGAAGEWLRGSKAHAAVAEAGRFQISSYGYAMPNGEQRQGAFILDTESGDLYQTATGAGTQKIGKLPR